MRSRGGACADGLPSSAEGPEEPGRPRDEAGAQGAGARLQGTDQGQNRAREKLCAAEEPPECSRFQTGWDLDCSASTWTHVFLSHRQQGNDKGLNVTLRT